MGLVTVFEGTSLAEVQIVTGILGAEGLHPHVPGEHFIASGGVASRYLCEKPGWIVEVPEAEALEAQRLIREAKWLGRAISEDEAQ